MGRLAVGAALVFGAATCSAALYALSGNTGYLFKKQTSSVESILEDLKKACDTPSSLLFEIVDEMVSEMKLGLANAEGCKLKMLPSFVDRLPDGNERGIFYALDLGGTNFRVLRVKLGGKEERITHQEFVEVSIPPELMTSTSDELFDFIAEKLNEFVESEKDQFRNDGENEETRKLGFTFSFPVDQTSISSGKLVRWTKGFKIDGVEGNDVVKILNDALIRKKLKLEVVALVNDTVGTLAGSHYNDDNSRVAVILGTGTNACYLEAMGEIKKWSGPIPESRKMVINMEWGNFNSPSLPITFADAQLDEESINPGEQVFEKLISGMYLGEIVRKVLLKMAIDARLFGPIIPSKLYQKISLSSPKMSKMDEDISSDLTHVSKILHEAFDIKETSLETRQTVKEVCEIVTRRGARLAAAGIIGVLKKIGRDGSAPPKDEPSIVVGSGNPTLTPNQRPANSVRTLVAVDGGLYEHYAKFRNQMHAALDELLGPESKMLVDVQLSNDGSGIGAALIAAACSSSP